MENQMASSVNEHEEWTTEELRQLVNNGEVPGYWTSDSRVTYGLLNRIISVCDSSGKVMKYALPSILALLKPKISQLSLPHVGNIREQLMRKKNIAHPENIVPWLKDERNSKIGPHCDAAGITTSTIQTSVDRGDSLRSVSNGVILELRGYRIKQKFTWKILCNWLFNLNICRSLPCPKKVQHRLTSMNKLKCGLERGKKKNSGQLNAFMQEIFQHFFDRGDTESQLTHREGTNRPVRKGDELHEESYTRKQPAFSNTTSDGPTHRLSAPETKGNISTTDHEHSGVSMSNRTFEYESKVNIPEQTPELQPLNLYVDTHTTYTGVKEDLSYYTGQDSPNMAFNESCQRPLDHIEIGQIKQEPITFNWDENTPCSSSKLELDGRISPHPADFTMDTGNGRLFTTVKLESPLSACTFQPCKTEDENKYCYLAETQTLSSIEPPYPVTLYQRQTMLEDTVTTTQTVGIDASNPDNAAENPAILSGGGPVGMCSLEMTANCNTDQRVRVDDVNHPHKCPVCNFRSARKTVIISHIRTHKDTDLRTITDNVSKPHKCPVCNFRAARKTIVESHLKTHENTDQPVIANSARRSYKCPACNFRSARKQDLNAHLISHEITLNAHNLSEPYKCPACNFRTASKPVMKSHRMTHETNVTYACSRCDYKSRTKSPVLRHIRKHNGEKPYKCSICDHSTFIRNNIVEHMKVHSKIGHTNVQVVMTGPVCKSSLPFFENSDQSENFVENQGISAADT